MRAVVALVALWMAATPLQAQPAPYMEGVGHLSRDVVEFLARNGVSPENWTSFLDGVKKLARPSRGGPARTRVLAAAVQDSAHPLWGAVVRAAKKAGARNVRLPGLGGAGGAVAAELLIEAWLVIEVGRLFYEAGHGCGVELLNAMEVEAATAEAAAVADVTALMHDALRSGRWRLKSGWTAEQATRQLLLNMRDNRCPYFAGLLEPVAAAPPLACLEVNRASRADILRDEHLRRAEELARTVGAGDPRIRDEQALAECYRAQGDKLRAQQRY